MIRVSKKLRRNLGTARLQLESAGLRLGAYETCGGEGRLEVAYAEINAALQLVQSARQEISNKLSDARKRKQKAAS